MLFPLAKTKCGSVPATIMRLAGVHDVTHMDNGALRFRARPFDVALPDRFKAAAPGKGKPGIGPESVGVTNAESQRVDASP